MLGLPKYNEKTEEHIREKKAICPKDGSIFDFMIRLPNDESEVIDNSPLLAVPETKRVKYVSISNETNVAEFELVETLLKKLVLKDIASHIHLIIFLTSFHYHAPLHHTAHYVIGNIPMIMHISDEIKNLIAFSITMPIKINNLGREIFH